MVQKSDIICGSGGGRDKLSLRCDTLCLIESTVQTDWAEDWLLVSCEVPFLTVLLYRYVHRAILVLIVGGGVFGILFYGSKTYTINFVKFN